MKFKKCFLFLLFALSCRHNEENISFVGLNKDGKEVVEYLPVSKYEKRISHYYNQISKKILKKISDLPSQKEFELSKVDIEIILDLSVGLSKFSTKLSPALRLTFSKNEI